MLIYEDETALLRKGLFDVQNEVGLGHREEYYHKAMTIWLKQRGIPHTTKMALPLLLDNESACMLYPDLTVWGKITLEMKAVQRNLRPPEQVQIFNYLKAQDHKLGLLVNMGLDRVFVKRFLHEKTPSELKEDWTYWNGAITDRVRETGQHIRATIHKIYDQHQCGYGSEVIEKLITFGLKQNNLSFVRGPIATSSFQGNPLGATALDCLIIEEHVLLVFTALFDDNKFNISRGHSFMKALNVPWGIAVNFGKKTVQLNGLSIGGTALPSEAHNSSSSSSIIRGTALPSEAHNSSSSSSSIIGGTALPSEAHNSSSSSSSIIRGTALPSEAHNSSSSSIIGGTALPSEAHNSSSSSIIGGTALPSEAHNSSSSSIIRGTALPSEAHNSSSSSSIIGGTALPSEAHNS